MEELIDKTVDVLDKVNIIFNKKLIKKILFFFFFF